jgi:hypothetical protein
MPEQIIPLATVYQDPAIAARAECHAEIRKEGGVPAVLGRAQALGALTTSDEIISHVQSLPEYDWQDNRERAAWLFGCLPTDVLLYNFGEEVTAWTLANDVRHRAKELATNLGDEGYDPVLLRKARLLAYEENRPPRGSDLLKQNAVGEWMQTGIVENVDLPEILQASAQPGVTISEKRAGDYRLIPLVSEENTTRPGGDVTEWEGRKEAQKPRLKYELWLDTPTGFALMYKGIPQFVIGVAAGRENELQVRQMQRWYGKEYELFGDKLQCTGTKQPRGLMPLDWERASALATEKLAARMGKESIGIISGNKVPSPDSGLTHSQARKIYDGAAKRLGFTQNAMTDDWLRPLES